MPALGWLLNLGMAGGDAAAPATDQLYWNGFEWVDWATFAWGQWGRFLFEPLVSEFAVLVGTDHSPTVLTGSGDAVTMLVGTDDTAMTLEGG